MTALDHSSSAPKPLSDSPYKGDFPLLNDFSKTVKLASSLNPGCRYVYLDSAASAHKPRAVIEAISSFYEASYSNIHRGAHRLSIEATNKYERARETVRSFIGAGDRREVIFCKGATEAINMVAFGFVASQLSAGDEILVSEMEHHANLIPWQQIARRQGATLAKIEVTDDGQVTIPQILDSLNRRTKLVALAQTSNVLGTINPAKKIVAAIRQHCTDKDLGNIPILIDGAQSIVHDPVNVEDLGCDFFVFSGHKLYGPTGVGVLYAKRCHHDALQPLHWGGGMVDRVTFEEASFDDAPGRYEAGTPHIAGAIGLEAAIKYVLSIDAAATHKMLAKGTEVLMRGLQEISGIKIIGPEIGLRAPIVSFAIEDVHAHDIATMLDEYGVAVRAGHHCARPILARFGIESAVRVSLGLYNSPGDCSYFLDMLKKSLAFFR